MKIPFINKIKHAARTGLTASILYASSSLPFTYSQEKDNPLKEISLPDKLTQQGEDFYKNPEKEFEVYKRKYLGLVLDGVIDSKDVEQLEVVLRKTLEEVDGKIHGGNGLKETFPTAEGSEYLKLVRVMKADLGELQEHLALKKEWLNSYAEGKFWNYGTGAWFYLRRVAEGNVKAPPYWGDNERKGLIEEVFSRKSFYPALVQDGSGDSSPSKYPEVPLLCREFPIQTKINYWLGLGLGLGLPIVMSHMLLKWRKRRKGKLSQEEIDSLVLSYGLGLPAAGYLFLDSLHPWAYPARIIVPPLIYYLANRNVKPATSASPRVPGFANAGSEVKKQEDGKKQSLEGLVDPWDIDIPKIEDQKTGRQY